MELSAGTSVVLEKSRPKGSVGFKCGSRTGLYSGNVIPFIVPSLGLKSVKSL